MKKTRFLALVCTLTLLLATCLSPLGAAALYELPEGKTLSSSSAILVALGATEDEDVVPVSYTHLYHSAEDLSLVLPGTAVNFLYLFSR